MRIKLLISLFGLLALCILCWWLAASRGPTPRQGGSVRPDAQREDNTVAISAAYVAALSTQDASSGSCHHAGTDLGPSMGGSCGGGLDLPSGGSYDGCC